MSEIIHLLLAYSTIQHWNAEFSTKIPPDLALNCRLTIIIYNFSLNLICVLKKINHPEYNPRISAYLKGVCYEIDNI